MGIFVSGHKSVRKEVKLSVIKGFDSEMYWCFKAQIIRGLKKIRLYQIDQNFYIYDMLLMHNTNSNDFE